MLTPLFSKPVPKSRLSGFLLWGALALFMPSAGFAQAPTAPMGAPVDLEAQRDYLREASEAGRLKDYLLAADRMRYSYHQAPDSYRFYWYLYWLSFLQDWPAIDALASAAPVDHLFHPAYGSGAARIWAKALLRLGRRSDAVDRLISAYRKNPAGEVKSARELVRHFWRTDEAGPEFLSHRDHRSLVQEFLRWARSDWKAETDFAKEFYHHLVTAQAAAAIRGDRDEESLYSAGRAQLITGFSISDAFINPANHRVLDQAFLFYRTGEPEATAGVYRFHWMNYYVPEVDVPASLDGSGAIQIRYAPDFIERRIVDTLQESQVARIFYYYLTGGKLLMDFSFRVLAARYTGIHADRKYLPPDQESLTPYPARDYVADFRLADGFMWWFPSYEGAAYLSAPGLMAFVPDLLSSQEWRMKSTMPTGASYSVIIHEIFHNFDGFLKLDSGHRYDRPAEAAWPDWYRKIVADNGAQTSEWLWYRTLLEKREFPGDFSLLTPRDKGWTPDEGSLERALRLWGSRDPRQWSRAEKLAEQARELIAVSRIEEGLALLRKARETAPDHPGLLFDEAYATQWKLKDRGKAQELYDEYLEKYSGLAQSDTALVYALGWYLSRSPETVLALLDRHGANPVSDHRRSEFMLHRIKALSQLGRTTEALTLAANYLEDPRDTLRSEFQSIMEKLGAKP